jgi:hypothetical protein
LKSFRTIYERQTSESNQKPNAVFMHSIEKFKHV